MVIGMEHLEMIGVLFSEAMASEKNDRHTCEHARAGHKVR